MKHRIVVIGAGLSGSEAALQCASLLPEAQIALYEMRPEHTTPAHQTSEPAELVCSNSFKSTQLDAAHGCAKAMLGQKSFVLNAAKVAAVPAGASLAVDRTELSAEVARQLARFPNIVRTTRCLEDIPPAHDADAVIVATGPLTHPAFATRLQELMGQKHLSFYDAIAPIVTLESLDLSQMYFASRYDKGPADFLNIPLTREQYDTLVDDLLHAEKMPLADFEKPNYFENCLPVEVIAERGRQTLAFGPMRPVGLDDPRTGKRPYAVIQLRREDRLGQCYNLVGFQTKMKYPEQIRVFRKLPGMQQAEFVRLGSIHRNTYIHSPTQLHPTLQWRQDPRVFFAGQLTGVEGYSEAVLTGWIAGRNCVRFLTGQTCDTGDTRELFGALLHHITDAELDRGSAGFQPMNLNFGVLDMREFPPELRRDKGAKRLWFAQRSVEFFQRGLLYRMDATSASAQRSICVEPINV